MTYILFLIILAVAFYFTTTGLNTYIDSLKINSNIKSFLKFSVYAIGSIITFAIIVIGAICASASETKK